MNRRSATWLSRAVASVPAGWRARIPGSLRRRLWSIVGGNPEAGPGAAAAGTAPATEPVPGEAAPPQRPARRVEADPRTAAFAGGSWRDPGPGEVVCNVCGWVGGRFEGVAHSESATCPSCGSIARDRFLWFCYLARQAYRPGLRVLETSPRLGPAYKAFMASWCHYYSADFMQSAHAGALCLDLQRLGLRDRCLDVVLTPHVLEHVPDTDAALTELHRVLAPAGAVYLQVPLLEGRTREPPELEYHGDDTKVFWRFGFDLTARLREHGFDASLLVTADFRRRVASGDLDWPDQHFDVAAMARHAVLDDLVVVCDDRTARLHGFEPSYWFATWEMVRR